MKKLLYFFVFLVIVYFLFTWIAPPIVEKGRNQFTIKPPYKVSQQAQQIFSDLEFVADLHCDALLWNRDLTKRSDYGHVDFPRMQEGNVAFQAFTIVTKSPQGQNFDNNSGDGMDMITALSIGQGQHPKTWFSLFNRAMYQCSKLMKFAKNFDDKFIVVRTKADFQKLLDKRAQDKSYIGGLLGVEGGHCLEGKIENLDKLYNAGVRMLGPAHFFDNEMGGSAHGVEKGALTDFGKQVLKKMQTKGMIMDIAHSSEKAIDDILRLYNGPILSSHTGVKGTKKGFRNLSDKHLRAIAQRDGLVGIGYFPGAIGEGGIKAIVKAMKYTKGIIGTNNIALGSDFDGSVTTPFDTTGLPLLVEEMMIQGFTPEEIKSIFGENLKRFLLKNLK